MSLAPRNLFFDSAPRTYQTVAAFVRPFRKGQWLSLVRAMVVWIPLLQFSLGGAAMFAEPAVPQVEEVGSLVHKAKNKSGRGQAKRAPAI